MKQRIVTGVIAAAAFLPIVLYGGWPLLILTYLIGTIGLQEALKMKRIPLISLPGLISVILLWILLIPDRFTPVIQEMGYDKLQLALLTVLVFLTYTVLSKNQFTFEGVGFSVLSALYVGLGFYYLFETREASAAYIFLALFIVYATDSGAYFVGRAMGKNKLWPEISPNKTVEGSIGGIVSAVVIAAIFAFLADLQISFPKLLISTVLLSVFGQIGDLVESALKRHYNVKDSGNILPGHGGILDRFDSLLFVLPLLHILQLV
ncbi:MAG TPA: phosphatidate cytidylyltransferase [Chondromyces sp.]|nr:phosphatidate cytidylyltransferase [Chondromyces sp.]